MSDPADTLPAPRPPAGLKLVCTTCRYVFPDNITVGVLAAHFATEPDHPEHPVVELAPLCRCGAAMTYDARVGDHDVFRCVPCRRTKRVPLATMWGDNPNPPAGLP